MFVIEIKKHFQLRAIEWWSAFALALWGFAVIAFPNMFDNSTFAGLKLFAPQHIWGLAALLIGLIRIAALAVNGFWHRTPIIRWATAILSIGVWFAISTGMFYAPAVSTGLFIYSWHMVADMYSAYRSASDFMEVEFERRGRSISLQGIASNVSSITGRDVIAN